MKLIQIDSVLMIYAFRYALGRRTHAVNDVARNLIQHKNSLEPNWRLQIVEEIEGAIEDGRAGDVCDVEQWRDVAKELSN